MKKKMKLAKTSKNEGSLLDFFGARSAPEKSSDPEFSEKKTLNLEHSRRLQRVILEDPLVYTRMKTGERRCGGCKTTGWVRTIN